MPLPFVNTDGFVRTTARLNLRQGNPTTSAPIQGKAEAGSVLAVKAAGKGQLVSGNDDWYRGEADVYFWSGACGPITAGAAINAIPTGAAIKVHRRNNGTILPLGDSERQSVFGTFTYDEAAGGRIVINPGWVSANIKSVATPMLASLGYPTMQLHRLAEVPFLAVMKAIGDAGLLGGLLTCAGSWVPRHKGWNPARGLSSHSWGIAVDFNVAWNSYGQAPAPLGAIGSVRQLVPYFEAEGFAWGGYFSHPDEDGMHFELARYDL